MRFLTLSILLAVACVNNPRARPVPTPEVSPLVVGVNVTDTRASPSAESVLRSALENRGLRPGASGDSAKYLIVLIVECAPRAPQPSACGDSTQLVFGVWSATAAAHPANDGYRPANFRSEHSGVVRVATASLGHWIRTFVDSISESCFDRERLRLGLVPASGSERDFRDDRVWRCRLPEGVARTP